MLMAYGSARFYFYKDTFYGRPRRSSIAFYTCVRGSDSHGNQVEYQVRVRRRTCASMVHVHARVLEYSS